jgi:hypothetical protein
MSNEIVVVKDAVVAVPKFGVGERVYLKVDDCIRCVKIKSVGVIIDAVSIMYQYEVVCVEEVGYEVFTTKAWEHNLRADANQFYANWV